VCNFYGRWKLEARSSMQRATSSMIDVSLFAATSFVFGLSRVSSLVFLYLASFDWLANLRAAFSKEVLLNS
jgi:hypothetical protein